MSLAVAGCGARIVGDGDAGRTSCASESETLCSGACVDTSSSASHCGACGNACAAEEACVSGACTLDCPSGQTVCDGACVVLDNDLANCGACGNACAAGEVCSSGACATSCGDGLLECGGVCRDAATDRAHCGACGLECASGQVCSDGVCLVSCTETLTDCDGSCRDLETDRLNCGACGEDCAPGELCSAGTCAITCGAGLTECGSSCRDTSTDRRHCGACDNECPAGTVCNGGACETTCTADLTVCDGSCRDLQSDRGNCGTCGTACARGEVCSLGVCELSCGADLTDCSGSCRDLTSDRAHCGACGATCDDGEVCTPGGCTTSCGAGLTECSEVCRDLSADRRHCGACGVACATGEICADGTCETSCGTGLTDCGGTCRDLATDRNHCGGCGIGCDPGEICSGALGCVLSCAAPMVICDGACTDLTSSRDHCGACDTPCGVGEVCSTSGGVTACALSCAPGLTDCGGSCVDVDHDPSHCTACGTTCGPYANARASCNSGCIMTCDPGFADCDGSPATGCESELATDVLHCGRCGNACSFANAAAACAGSTCAMGACDAGFGDCDGSPANGCECRIATGGPPFSTGGGTLRDLAEDPATGGVSPSGMVMDTSRDFLWVVNVAESSVSRWDANMQAEIARYRVGLPAGECLGVCCHANACNMPSRVVVDGNGDAYIANRGFGMQGTVTKIAGDVAECVDRNGNGMIDTSTTTTAMPYGADECVLWTTNVGVVNGVLRSITVDRGDGTRPNGYVWVGAYNSGIMYRLDPITGATLDTVPIGINPYGSVVTSDGRLWVTGLGTQVQPVDTVTRVVGAVVNLPNSIYGQSADANGRLWMVYPGQNYILGYDPMTGATSRVTLRSATSSGVTVDALGNVWTGLNEGVRTSLVRLPTSAFVAGASTASPGTIPTTALTYFDGPAPAGTTASAVGVDRSGAVWLASLNGNSRLLRLDPSTGTFVEHLGPNMTYSYSDFTGSVRRASIPQGSYEQTFDLTCANPSLTRLEIDGVFPTDTSTTVSMRTASTVAGLGGATVVSIAALPPLASPYALTPPFMAAGVTPEQQLRVTIVLRASAAGAVPILNGVRVVWTCP